MSDNFYLHIVQTTTVNRISRKLLFYERYLRVPYLIGPHLFVIVNARERFQVITEDKCSALRPLVFVSLPWINFVRALNDGKIDIKIPGRSSQVIAE